MMHRDCGSNGRNIGRCSDRKSLASESRKDSTHQEANKANIYKTEKTEKRVELVKMLY